jgi:hypothetical protein
VALVLNATTGHVSPQFHVIFDPTFQTVKEEYGNWSPIVKWQQACGFKSNDGSTGKAPGQAAMQAQQQLNAEPGAYSDQPPMEESMDWQLSQEPASRWEQEQDQLPHNEAELGNGRCIARQSYTTDVGTIHEEQTMTRSGRLSRAPTRLIQIMATMILWATSTAHVWADPSGHTPDLIPFNGPVKSKVLCYNALHSDKLLGMQHHHHPLFAYGALNNPDTLYYHKAMKELDKDQFLRAMEKEFLDQYNNGNFVLIRRKHVCNTHGFPIVTHVRTYGFRRDSYESIHE